MGPGASQAELFLSVGVASVAYVWTLLSSQDRSLHWSNLQVALAAAALLAFDLAGGGGSQRDG